MLNYSNLFSEVTKRTKASVIRELLKLTAKPEIISFAGGLPDPKEFPVEDVKKMFDIILNKYSSAALQYGATEGCASLKTALCKWLKDVEDIDVADNQMLITSASQQALDMVARIFINPGDRIIVATPTYLGALQSFQTAGADIKGADSDDDGVIPESLEKCLEQTKEEGKQCKFVYLVPDFQNPTGVTIPQERRLKILETAKKYNTVIVEDSPYRQVRFEGEAPKTFYNLDKGQGNVITLFTFSKIFVPGFRLGYIIANEEVIRKFVVLKQAMDLCSPSILQLATAEYINGGYLEKHIKRVVEVYRKKRTAMLAALEKYMPEGVKWTRPEGGLFLWVTLPKYLDTEKMFPSAIENNVAYVVGSAFYYDGKTKNDMRLNFSYATPEEIDEGIKRLALAVKKNLK
ncbi:Aminotransferase class I and II [Elusimicrobium minutum Pei191]|uniref:Aminotransferase class I and II n=1 Tax=Elusimicrobium minutum (strain Pei191) TaxID=445932 RepID=B2KBF6_ELUMP|nr:PLP-dependent aminotransferase family protein [Elusimicrobium minutum]ACC97978.1 Aminotransferase class I and II [Elusimicrobium minutum Pei191]